MMKDLPNPELSMFYTLSDEFPDDVIAAGKAVLDKMQGEENEIESGWIWYRIGLAQILKVQYDAASDCLNQALHLHQSTGDEKAVLDDKLALGLLYFLQEQHEKAFETFMIVRNRARELNLTDIEKAASCNMGRICRSQGRYQEGMDFLNSALLLVEQSPETDCRAAILHEKGKIQLEQGLLDQAAPNLETAVLEAEKLNDPFLYSFQVALADLYTRSGRYDESSTILQKTLETCRKSGKIHGEIEVLYQQGLLESARGNSEKARELWEECYQITGRLSEQHFRVLSGEKLVEDYCRSGNSKKSLEYMMEIRQLEMESRSRRLYKAISTYDQSMRIGDLEREMQAWRRRSGELEQIRNDREESIRELEIIKDIGQQITGTLEAERIVGILHDRLSELVTVDSLFIGFYQEESEEMDFRYMIENGKRLPPIVVHMKENERLSAYVAKNKCDLIINDKTEQSFYLDRLRRVKGTQLANQSFLFVHLKTDGLGSGILSVQAQKKNCYRERHLKVLQALSGFVAVALSNAHSHQNLVLANKKIAHMATHDTLTGLPNRMQIIQHLELALKRCERYSESLAVLFVDLDGFKTINDTHGHRAGDALLVELSRRLSSGVRATDYVGRLAGDEFLVILTDDCTISDGIILAENLRKRITTPFTYEGKSLAVSASIGLALYPEDGRDPEALVNAADGCMYDAKDGGKNRVAHSTRHPADS